jgi:Ca2+-binding EF-hand superfamily protein
MKRLTVWMGVMAIAALASGCSSKGRYHDTALPDPKPYNAAFENMDANKDGRVSWEEFKAYFPQAEPRVFSAIDLNKDGAIDHDEWHSFKAAHNLEHPD